MLRHDVRGARKPPLDRPHVRRGLVIDAPQPHRRDGPGGGGDRAAAVLGADPRVRSGAAEAGLEAVVRRRGHHDLADRRRVVEDIAERAAQPGGVELLGAAQRRLLPHREQQLEAHGRPLHRRASSGGQQDRDGRLVVGTEDRLARADPATVDAHRLDSAVVGHGVEVRAEQDRSIGVAPGDPREQVAGLVGLDVQPHPPQLVAHAHRDRRLLAGDRADAAQLGELVVQPTAFDVSCGPHLRQRAARPSAYAPAPRRRTPGTAEPGARAGT